jgi:uncharacterized protein YcbX
VDAEQGTPTGLVVEELWRYPVKSMGGERLTSAEVGELGIDGDRRWGVVDRETGRLLTGRRAPALLMARARHLGPGAVEITLPDGTVTSDDAVLSDWLERPVTLVPSTGGTTDPIFEASADPDEKVWGAYGTADGAWHDLARARLSLVSRATIRDWHPSRFRSNVLLGGSGEDDLVDAELRIGTATLLTTGGIGRCVMVNRPRPGVDADRSVLRTILDERAGRLAIGVLVTIPGRITEGAPVLLSG